MASHHQTPEVAHAKHLYRSALATLRTAHVHEARLNCLASAEQARKFLTGADIRNAIRPIKASGTPARAIPPRPFPQATRDRLAGLRASWAVAAAPVLGVAA